jgi:hypothetical protein|nr:MAG TPA: hypothetical protein [Bacteriophage sp.]
MKNPQYRHMTTTEKHEERISLPASVLLLEEGIAKGLGITIGERMRALAIAKAQRELATKKKPEPAKR